MDRDAADRLGGVRVEQRPDRRKVLGQGAPHRVVQPCEVRQVALPAAGEAGRFRGPELPAGAERGQQPAQLSAERRRRVLRVGFHAFRPEGVG